MENIMKIVKFFEDSSLLLKDVSETIQNEPKEQKGGFLNMLLGTLGASLLGNMLSDKAIIRPGYGSKDLKFKVGKGFNKGKGIIRAGYQSKDF